MRKNRVVMDLDTVLEGVMLIVVEVVARTLSDVIAELLSIAIVTLKEVA